MKKENTFEYWWEYYLNRHGFDGSLEEAKGLAENVFYAYHSKILEDKIESGEYIVNPKFKELFIPSEEDKRKQKLFEHIHKTTKNFK